MDLTAKRTPLHDWHVSNKANMAEFGGYHMPLWYPTGARKEHISVIENVGIFDTSHMAAVLVEGPDAMSLLQYCFSRDLEKTGPQKNKPVSAGTCLYGVFLNEDGHVVDDAVLYRLGKNGFLIVANAGMGRTIADHLKEHASGRSVTLSNKTDTIGKIDIQGPRSAIVLSGILEEPSSVFTSFPYFTFKGDIFHSPSSHSEVTLKNGGRALLSRTGYTGEFGFELFVPSDSLIGLWEQILETGQTEGICACGLAARDSLRTGALLPLSHQDIGAWPFINTPWSFALPYNSNNTGFTKQFLGSDSLAATNRPAFTLPFLGRHLRKVTAADASVWDKEGNRIGSVLTCVTDMAIDYHESALYSIASPDRPEGFSPKGLACGFVRVDSQLKTGDTIELRDQRRRISVTVVDTIRPNLSGRKPISAFL